jgi:thiamine biosynthesis lipoprotein
VKHASASYPSRRFDIMGTEADLLLDAKRSIARELFDEAQIELERLHAKFTRFDPESPIERLNDAGGGEVDDEMREVLELSLQAHAMSGGRVDVCIGSDLIAAGYDRDFDLLDVPESDQIAEAARAGDGWLLTPHSLPTRAPGYRFEQDGTVTIQPGVRIDLGGIVKGWAADKICTMLAPAGSCIVDLGGDMAVSMAPDTDGVPIGVDLVSEMRTFMVRSGGIATSGQDRRVWRTTAREGDGDARHAHHLIDPRTGAPAETDVLRVTVIADDCFLAEVCTKALFLQGADAAIAEADASELLAVVVDVHGKARVSAGLASF